MVALDFVPPAPETKRKKKKGGGLAFNAPSMPKMRKSKRGAASFSLDGGDCRRERMEDFDLQGESSFCDMGSDEECEEESSSFACSSSSRGNRSRGQGPPAPGGGFNHEEAGPDDSGIEAGEPEEIALRSNFNPLAHFSASAEVDSEGFAEVPVKIADALTCYRIFAVVASKDLLRYGSGESSVLSQLPLTLRISAPRFLNFGDTSTVTAVVQNLTSQELELRIAGRSLSSAATLSAVTALRSSLASCDGVGYLLQVPSNRTVTVDFQVEAFGAGSVRIQVACMAGSFGDAATVEFDALPPLDCSSNVVAGELMGRSELLAQSLTAPSNCLPQFGTLRVQVANSVMPNLRPVLEDAMQTCYSFLEPTISQFIVLDSLESVVETDSKSLRAMARFVTKGAKKRLHKEAKSIRFRTHSRYSSSYVPRFCVPFAVLALAVDGKPSALLQPKWMSQLVKGVTDSLGRVPSGSTELAMYAFQLYACNSWEKKASHKKKALAVLKQRYLEELTLDTVGWLLAVAGEQNANTMEVLNFLESELIRDGGKGSFFADSPSTAYRRTLLQSTTRTDAVVLIGALSVYPQHPIVRPLVRGLLAARTSKGLWAVPQEAAWASLALRLYSDKCEKKVKSSTKIWINRNFCGELALGVDPQSEAVSIPMQYFAEDEHKDSELLVSKQGPGIAFYQLSLSYAFQNLSTAAQDNGLVVTRRFASHSGSYKQVVVNEDSSVVIPVNERVLVTLTVESFAKISNLVLIDNLAAGLEAQNPLLAPIPKAVLTLAEEEEEAGAASDSFLELLPEETLLQIFSYLDSRSLGRMARVSRLAKMLSCDESLWPSPGRPSAFGPVWYTAKERYLVANGILTAADLQTCRAAAAGVAVASQWYKHESLRTERVEVFAQDLEPGKYEYSYVARATKLGVYSAPAARALEVYEPDINGRCASDVITVQ